MASTAGDTPSYSYIDMTASHPTALSLSYAMHPPYVVFRSVDVHHRIPCRPPERLLEPVALQHACLVKRNILVNLSLEWHNKEEEGED